jgi:hypothetical protein
MNIALPQIHPAARAALALPPFETPEWRADFGRGIRLALGAAGARPGYLALAIDRMRDALEGTDLYEVSAPGASGNTKLAKNAAVTLAFTGASGADSGTFNPCPALGACASFCVLGATCGRARMAPDAIIGARRRRLIAMRAHPVAAGAMLASRAAAARRLANALGIRCIARMNVGTDIGFESIPELTDMLGRFAIDAYAYTKRPAAVRSAMRGAGYAGATRIVYSYSERASDSLASQYLRAGGNVAVVVGGLGRTDPAESFDTFEIAGERFPIVSGDATDDRTTDAPGSVVALRGKGPLASSAGLDSADPYGFAIRPDDPRLGRR